MINIWQIILLFMVTLALTIAEIPGRKDQPRMGGWKDVDKNDSGVQKAVQIALKEHNKASNDQYINVVSNVIRARVQIVAGMKYSLNVWIAQTACRKSESAPENCTESELSALSQHKRCNFVVLIVPWMKREELIQNSCASTLGA